MKSITKKRFAAYCVDAAISGAAALGVEYILRKKIKSEVVHQAVTPTAVLLGLEYVQLYTRQQTLGYQLMGLKLHSTSGDALSAKMLAKRITYRELLSSIKYLQNRDAFGGTDGSAFPHDRFAGTIVEEQR